jgi:hypothetical protein
LRIFDAATFSIALVIFCMFFTEAILERISFSPAISQFPVIAKSDAARQTGLHFAADSQ